MENSVNWLSRLNPINKLFGRIFLWFWLATFLMMSSAVWLARQLASGYELQPISAESRLMLQSTAAKLERVSSRRAGDNLSLLLGRMGHPGRMALMLVEVESKRFIYGFPRPLQPDKKPFIELLSHTTPFSVKTSTGVFHGPYELTIRGKEYVLFAGNPYPLGMMQRFRRQHPMILFGFAILLSGGFCALLTWSLLRPIRQLKEAANSMSQGDLTTRVGGVSQRHDELGQLGKEFNRMSEQLELLVSSQKRLLADISHELRSPLARLQVAIGIAQQQDEQHMSLITSKQLARIEKEAAEIDTMIGQLLKLSRLESDTPIQALQKINLTSLVTTVVNDADFEAQSLDKSVILIAQQDSEITAEPDLLSSAISNVVRNAVKYAEREVRVEQQIGDGYVSVIVSDDGPGIPEEELDDIFRPFYRLSASRNRDSGGVGLGLAIAQRAIASHKGSISAENLTSGGLKVTIKLPIGQNAL